AGRAIALPAPRAVKRRRPCVGSRKPRVICRRVLLPQPLGPISAVTFPGSNAQVTASSATVGVADEGANVSPTSSNSIETAGMPVHDVQVNGLLLLNLASASTAGDRSNNCSCVTLAFTNLILFQNLPCATQESTLGIPFSSNQVHLGAAFSIKGAGTFVASEMILMTPASFAAAALLNSRPAWVCTMAKRTAADLLAARNFEDITQQASWAFGSISEPAPMILPTLFFSARKASGTGILAASACPAPISLIMSG